MQDFANFNELSRSLRDLDERALVLTLAAFAEDTLGDLISVYLIPSSAAHSLVTGYNAPLGTLSSRIKAAYALGLISKGQFEDLQHLRAIRNKFSHTWKPLSFEDPSVSGHIKAIRFGKAITTYPENPQHKLMTSFQILLIELRVAVSYVPKGNGAKFIGAMLLANISGSSFEERLETAIKEVANTERDYEVAEGEKKTFLEGVLWLWKDKLSRLLNEAPLDQVPDVKQLLDRLDKQLAGRSDPNG